MGLRQHLACSISLVHDSFGQSTAILRARRSLLSRNRVVLVALGMSSRTPYN